MTESMENYADEIDRANMIANVFLSEAVEEVARRCAPETHPDFDGTHCVECGDDIPAERLNLGRIRCVYCQERIEKLSKLRR